MPGEQEVASMYVGIRGDAASALNALKQTKDALKQAGGQAQNAANGFGNVQGSINNLRNPLSSLQSTIMGVAASWGVLKAAQGAWSLGMDAARVHEMNAVLRALAANNDVAETAIWGAVDAVKAMGIETQVAQQTIAQFTRYEMDMAKAGDLARVAQDAAVLSQQNSSEALAGLIYGITTYNQRVLRTHGLNVDMSNAFDAYAEATGKAADELSEAERVQAALNAVIQEGTRITGSYASAMEEPGKRWRSLPRYVNEIKVSIGEAFLPVIGAAADGLTNLSKAVLANADTFVAILKPIGEAAAAVITFVTALATLGVESVAAQGDLQAATDKIVAMGDRAIESRGKLFDLAAAWAAFKDIPGIQQGIADKMARTAEVAEYMKDHVEGAGGELTRLANEYAAAMKKTEGAQGGNSLAAQRARYDAMIEYNQAVLALADSYGIAASEAKNLDAAADMAARGGAQAAGLAKRGINEEAVARMNVVPAIDAQANALRRLAAARDADTGLATMARANMKFYREQISKYSNVGGGGGTDTGKQIAERQQEWERDRVESAKRAALEIRYWEQDQQEWIADNAAKLTPELQKEFSDRTAAAKAEAERVKETDAGLAKDLLSAEAEYQQEKASIATDESLSEEERTAKLAILDRENAERVQRAQETAALEAQIREEGRQREIQQMREAGAAGGQAFAEELKKALAGFQTEQDRLNGIRLKQREEEKRIADSMFDGAIADATTLSGMPIIGKLFGGAAPSLPVGVNPYAPGAGQHVPGAGYDQGGVVPGPIGAPQIAVVHGGERITPASRPAPGGGSGITVLITGPVYATTAQEAQRAGEGIGRGIRMGAKSGGIAL